MAVTANLDAEVTEDHEDGVDVTEALRVSIDIFFTLLSAYVFWTYAKDRPEYQVAAERVRAWWHKVTTATANVRQAERETVFEAIMIVGDD